MARKPWSRFLDVNDGVDSKDAGTTSGASAQPVSVATLVVLSRLVDHVNALENAQDAAKQLPLRLMAEQERIKLQAAQAAITARKAEVGYLQQLAEILSLQADRLARVLDFLGQVQALDAEGDNLLAGKAARQRPAGKGGCDDSDVIPLDRKQQTFAQQLCASGPGVRVRLLQAAVGYVDVVRRLQPQRYKLEYARIDALDQQSMAYSSANLQRQATIGPAVSGLRLLRQRYRTLHHRQSLVGGGHRCFGGAFVACCRDSRQTLKAILLIS